MNTTNEMREIADGLGSGVSQDQIRTSIDYGEQFLQEIKDRSKLFLGYKYSSCTLGKYVSYFESIIT